MLEQLMFVIDGERDDRARRTGERRMLESELVGCVDRLSDLSAGRKVTSDEDVKFLDRGGQLMVEHEIELRTTSSPTSTLSS